MNELVVEMSSNNLTQTAERVVPEGYKKTEVGVIPEDWEVLSIGEVLQIKHGKDQKLVESENGVFPIYGTGGLMGYANSSLYNKPSVLIGRKGSINKPRYIEKPFWTVDTLFYSEIKNNHHVKFIFYKFCMINWEIYNEASGVPSLNAKTIEGVTLGLPKLEEQTVIANALSDIDALIDELEKLIYKKQAIKTATMQQLLTGRTRLPQFAVREDGTLKGTKKSELGEIPEDWGARTIIELGRVSTGGTPLTSLTDFWNGDIPWVTPTDITGHKNIFSSERQISLNGLDEIESLPENTVLVTCIASIGKNAVLRKAGACNQQINAVIPNKNVDVDFLFYAIEFSKDRLKASAGITATLIVSKTLFESFKLVLSLEKEEQTAIGQILSDMDDEIQLIEQRLTKTRHVKQGMMQELLTGKTRLIHKDVV